MIAPPKAGDLVPSWWDTNDGRPDGKHLARILEVLPYKGGFQKWYGHVLVLEGTQTRPRIKMAWPIGEATVSA